MHNGFYSGIVSMVSSSFANVSHSFDGRLLSARLCQVPGEVPVLAMLEGLLGSVFFKVGTPKMA